MVLGIELGIGLNPCTISLVLVVLSYFSNAHLQITPLYGFKYDRGNNSVHKTR